ncbi:MAG: pantoate--beta-alanine ligase [Filomicrobium sp.]|nr:MULTISPECIES: pantoate--beta-alanine ligase [Filomicrobium]MCV0368611.1 pantoate--beta-alanine ligase [Filomicrobium sp.]
MRTVADLRQATAPWRRKAEPIALVPTMGALHAGHISLVQAAKRAAKHTIVSIFVNPTQFAPNEDLDRYPRDEDGDVGRLRENEVDMVWAPPAEEMYPEGYSTYVSAGSTANGLETDFRPHFFQGVATIVLKLLNQVAPDYVTFGEKDYQQLCVVRQMVRDLNVPTEIIAVPTVREKDGLALSSRNAYLAPREREVAPHLHRTIYEVADAAKTGNLGVLRADAAMKLLSLGFNKVDYVEIRDAETLGTFDPSSGRPGRVLAAAWLGRTRLIDNVSISP